ARNHRGATAICAVVRVLTDRRAARRQTDQPVPGVVDGAVAAGWRGGLWYGGHVAGSIVGRRHPATARDSRNLINGVAGAGLLKRPSAPGVSLVEGRPVAGRVKAPSLSENLCAGNDAVVRAVELPAIEPRQTVERVQSIQFIEVHATGFGYGV